MRDLKKKFIGKGQEVRGFEFRQLSVTDRGFLYEVKNYDSIYYEVFKKRINTRFNNISYPGSASFGKWAWTYQDYDKAIQKLNSL